MRHSPVKSFNLTRYVLLVDGIVTIVAAAVGLFLLPDYPATTRTLSRRQRELATIRLLKHGQDTGSSTSHGVERLTHFEAIVAAIRDPRVHMLMALAALVAATGSLSHLLMTSTIQMGYNPLRAHHPSVLALVVSVVLVNLVAWTSDRTNDRRWHTVITLGLAMVGAVIGATSPASGIKAIFASVFVAGLWSGVPVIMAWAANTINAPAEKRAIVIATIHGVSGIATAVGTHIWPRAVGSRQQISRVMAATFLGVALAIVSIVPSCVSLSSYRGTRAERNQMIRRRRKYQEDEY